MFKRLGLSLAKFVSCERGNFVVLGVFAFPVLLGIAGAVVDFTIYDSHHKRLQQIADGAVLAAAREAGLEGWSQKTAQAVADSFIRANLATRTTDTVVYSAAIEVDTNHRKVSVTIDQDHYGYFVAGYFKHSPQIRVRAAAQYSGSANVCVIGIDTTAIGTVSLTNGAKISASNCAVYSNSTNPDGLQLLENSSLTASLACSAGGYEGAPRNYSKTPLTDCPVVQDPLLDRPAPITGSCPLLSIGKILEGLPVVVVEAGTHCGGLTIKGYTKAIFAPGIHTFKDGPLIVADNATVDGLGGVGLYFTGKNARFEFTKNARVDLKAPTKGSMAGLLVFQDRKSAFQNFVISSDYTRNLIGTIYLSNGDLTINATNNVAEESAYTAIVVKKLRLLSNPNLVLNTDYDSTTVPVPLGLGPTGGTLRLAR